NLKLEAIDVFTNSFKSGPYRCVSHPNGTFALEITMEKAAYAIGMDPIAFRLMNLNEVGNPDTKAPFSNPGIRDCITAVRDQVGWAQKWHAPKANQVRPGVYHGIGMAAHACSHGAGGNPASGQVVINSDGTVQCISANNDIGDGQRTEMMMITAETLGVPLNSVTITPYVDTDLTTDASGTFGSQQTNTGGRGQFEAATDARKQILDWGARKFNDDATKASQPATNTAADMDMVDGKVFNKNAANKTHTLAEVMAFKTSGAIVGRADYVQDPKWQRTAWAARAADGSPRADDHERGLQRGRRLGHGHAADAGEASRRAQGRLGGRKKMRAFELYDATTVAQAVDLLKQNSSRATKVVGGGSDLIGGILKDWVHGAGLPFPDVIVDLTTIKDLSTISVDGGGATIGATATLTDVIEHKDIASKFPLLTAAPLTVASPLIRNFGTLGGNVNQ